MKLLTKIVSIILIMSFLMTGIVFADETIDVDLSGYKILEDMFRSVGILTDDDTFASDYLKDISEDEMNTMISNLIGIDYTEKSDGEFNFNRAVKKVLTLVGYDIVAVRRGPYPNGHIAVGQEIGLFKGLSLKGENSLSVGEAMRLMYNAVHINMIDITVYGSKPEYNVINETLLNRYKKIYFVEGIVTDNAITNFDGVSQINRDEIKIEKVIYRTNELKYTDLIGKVIEGYYHKDINGERHIVYATEAKKSYKSIKILAKDILGYNKFSFSYTSNNTTKTINLTPSVIVIYNNIASANYTDATFKPKSGYVEFIDNNRDSVYDVAIIKSYENMILKGTKKETLTINDLTDSKKDITLENMKNKYIIKTTNGEIVDFDYFKQYDVLSVAKAEDNKFIEFIVSNKFASGDVTEISFAENPKRVNFNDKSYFVDPEYTTIKNDISPGMYGTALLDFEGDIVFFVDETGNTRYGYVIAGEEARKSRKNRLFLELLTQDNEVVVYECDDKVVVNGEKKTTVTGIKNEIFAGDNAKQQLIKYRLDGEGKISLIDTPMDVTTESPAYTAKEPYDQNHLRVYAKGKSGIYYSGGNSINAEIMLGLQTKIFVVPTGTSTDEEKFQVIPRTSLSNGGSDGSFDAYTTDMDCLTAEILVTTSINIGSKNLTCMIDAVNQAIDEDGMITNVIYATTNGKKERIIVDTDYLNSVQVQAGDAALIRVAENGKAIGATVVYRKGRAFATGGSFNSSYYSVSGYVYNHKSGILQLTQKPLADLSRISSPKDSKYFMDSVPTYIWYDDEAVFETLSSADIYDFKNDGQPDTALVILQTGVPKLIIIYR